MSRRGSVAIFFVVTVGAGVAAGPPASAAEEPAAPRRVLVFSLPHVAWADLDRYELPSLQRVLDGAGVAALTTRAEERETLLADGYLTFGAGTRAVGDPETDGENFGIDEQFGDTTAGDAFTRRTGRALRGKIVSLASPRVFDVNSELLYDAEIGALADALSRAGIRRAVIGNADGQKPDTRPERRNSTPRRQVALGLMSSYGTVSDGRVDDGILERDPTAPFGLRLDEDAVAAAFETAWSDDSVVLVEASDLVRADLAQEWSTPSHGEAIVRQALRRSDQLLGRLLEDVDLERDAVIVFGPAHSTETITTTVLGVHTPGMRPGLLRSATTRRAGFVQLVDLAPTLLEMLDIGRPGSMEGRAVELGTRGGNAADRRELFIDEDAAAQFRDARVGQVQTMFVCIAGVLLGGTIFVLRRARPAWAMQLVGRLALCSLALVPTVFLVRLFPLHEAGAAAYWAFLVAGSIGLGTLYHRVGRSDPTDALFLALTLNVAPFLIDVVVGTPLEFNSALGYSPTVGGRFAGFSNHAYAALGASTVLLAPLLARRVGGSRGVRAVAALFVLVVVVDGAPFWGSDVGGILSLVPAFGVMMVMLLGSRVRWSTVGWCLAGLVVALVAFTAVDLSRTPGQRTHLGRLVERIQDQGLGDFVVIVQRKLAANLLTLTTSVWGVMLPIALVLAVWLAKRSRPRLDAVWSIYPNARIALVGFSVLAVLGYALNDSGIAITGLMLAILVGSVVWLVTTVELAPAAATPRPRAAARARSR